MSIREAVGARLDSIWSASTQSGRGDGHTVIQSTEKVERMRANGEADNGGTVLERKRLMILGRVLTLALKRFCGVTTYY